MHVLVIGGTGMLKGIVEYYVKRGEKVTVVARKESRLLQLKQEMKELKGDIHCIAVDYKDTEKLEQELTTAIEVFGAFSYSFNWIHSDATETPYVLARLLNRISKECTYVRILGSRAAHPEKGLDERELFNKLFPNIKYQEVVLGFMIEGDESRWLTNNEICQGIRKAVTRPQDRFIVGIVRPWSSRP
ncbi:SDR family NAD(P)-dependent oxidoreductase [Fredinandcohnia humi]